MQQDQRIIITAPFPEWAKKGCLTNQFTIASTGKNENDRTPISHYLIRNGEVTIYPGELLDSESDFESFATMNRDAEEFRRDHIIKQVRSEQEARNIVLTA